MIYNTLCTVYMCLLLHSTIVVEPGCIATITECGDIQIVVCDLNFHYCYSSLGERRKIKNEPACTCT